MSRKISVAEQKKIKNIITHWINGGCWDSSLYAAACLGAVFGITITHSKFIVINDILRSARITNYTYPDELTEKIVHTIEKFEE